MYTDSRENEVALLKKLWCGEKIVCPKCGSGTLTTLHKKAKKNNTDWICPACGEIFRTINMLYDLPDR